METNLRGDDKSKEIISQIIGIVTTPNYSTGGMLIEIKKLLEVNIPKVEPVAVPIVEEDGSQNDLWKEIEEINNGWLLPSERMERYISKFIISRKP